MTRDWRKYVDPLIREHLEAQIKNTLTHQKAYEAADNKGNAQLWVALANLSKQLFNTTMKLNYMEDVLKDLVKKLDTSSSKKEEVAFMETPSAVVAEQPLEKKTTPQKTTPKKTVAKKPAPKKKVAQKKPPVKKTSRRKTAPKKHSSRVKRSLRRF